MKKLTIFLNIILISFVCQAQVVNFKKLDNWNQVLELARNENKYIFVDCFTTWCGPCKKIDSEIFNNSLVSSFLNKNYINIKIQFDSTSKDSKLTQGWYQFSKNFGKENGVVAFPTFLFFDLNGRLVSREVGSDFGPMEFVSMLERKLDPSKQYFTVKAKYLGGDRSPQLIRFILPEAIKLSDMKIANDVHDLFVKIVDTPYSAKEVEAICASMTSTNSAGFPVIVSYVENKSRLLSNQGFAKDMVKLLIRQRVFKLLKEEKTRKINWKKVSEEVGKFSKSLSGEIVMEMQIEDARRHENWEGMGRIKMDYYDRYERDFDHNAKFFMNNDLMEIFMKCSDKHTLLRAAEWSKRTINRVEGEESPSCMDTYANLLYKAGKTREALIWQEKALAVATKQNRSDLSGFMENLKKMKSGEKTWTSSTQN